MPARVLVSRSPLKGISVPPPVLSFRPPSDGVHRNSPASRLPMQREHKRRLRPWYRLASGSRNCLHRVEPMSGVSCHDRSRHVRTTQPFRLEEATIAELHEAIRAGSHDLRRHRSTLHRSCTGVQRRRQHAGHRGRRFNSRSAWGGKRHGANPFPHRHGQGRHAPAGSRQVHRGPPLEFGRMEPTASDPSVQQQFGMIVGSAECPPGERARDTQYPRRTLCHMPRRVRPPSSGRTAAAGRAAGLRNIPPPARCAGACGRT